MSEQTVSLYGRRFNPNSKVFIASLADLTSAIIMVWSNIKDHAAKAQTTFEQEIVKSFGDKLNILVQLVDDAYVSAFVGEHGTSSDFDLFSAVFLENFSAGFIFRGDVTLDEATMNTKEKKPQLVTLLRALCKKLRNLQELYIPKQSNKLVGVYLIDLQESFDNIIAFLGETVEVLVVKEVPKDPENPEGEKIQETRKVITEPFCDLVQSSFKLAADKQRQATAIFRERKQQRKEREEPGWKEVGKGKPISK